MKFIHPSILWALLIILIPIIIHLLNLRKFKPLFFPNVQFLNLVKEQTKKKSSIKRWVQLLLRCLAFTALILAFAQPYFPAAIGAKKSGKTIVAIYLDNSFSMQGKNETGSLFEQAKQQAIEIVKSFGSGTAFIFTNNQLLASHSKPCDAKQAIQFIQQTNITGQRTDIPAIQARHLQSLPKDAGQVFYFYLSDFQKNQFTTNQLLTDSIGEYVLLQFEHAINQNVAIDSIWFSRPTLLAGSIQQINIRLKNEGGEKIENYPVKISTNNTQKQQLSIELKANGVTDVSTTLRLPNESTLTGRVSIEDFPITFDNDLLFALNIQQNITVHTLYSNENQPLKHFFSTDTMFHCKWSKFSNANLSEMDQAEVLVILEPDVISAGLNLKISEWVKAGKTVIFLPNEQTNLTQSNALFTQLGIPLWKAFENQASSINQWELDHPLFTGVLERKPTQLNHPKVLGYFPTLNSNNSIARIGNKPMIEHFTVELGHFYRINTSVNAKNGNLSSHALFLTALFRMGEMANQMAKPYYTIGANESIAVDYALKNDEVISLQSKKQNVIPYQLPRGNKTIVSVPSSLEQSDYYQLKTDEKDLQTLALNYNRHESSLEIWNVEALSAAMQLMGLHTNTLTYQADDTTKKIDLLTNKSVLWQYCLWIMLLFLTFEILLNKRW